MEGGMAGLAAVEAEDELVKVGLQVLGPQAVVDPERPVLRLEKMSWTQGRTRWVGGHLLAGPVAKATYQCVFRRCCTSRISPQ